MYVDVQNLEMGFERRRITLDFFFLFSARLYIYIYKDKMDIKKKLKL